MSNRWLDAICCSIRRPAYHLSNFPHVVLLKLSPSSHFSSLAFKVYSQFSAENVICQPIFQLVRVAMETARTLCRSMNNLSML